MLFKSHIKPQKQMFSEERTSCNAAFLFPQNNVMIIRRKHILFLRFTALSCSRTQAGSPQLSSVFLTLFIFVLKILGMSSLGFFFGGLLTTQMCREAFKVCV